MTLKPFISYTLIMGLSLSLSACKTMSPEEAACRKTELKTPETTVSNMENWLKALGEDIPADNAAPGGYTLNYMAARYSTSKEKSKTAMDHCLDVAVELKECDKYMIQKGGFKSDVTRQLVAPPRLRLSDCTGKAMKHWVVPSREEQPS